VGPGDRVRVRERGPDPVGRRELLRALLAAAGDHDLVRAPAARADQPGHEGLAHPAAAEEGHLAIAGRAHPSAPAGRAGSILTAPPALIRAGSAIRLGAGEMPERSNSRNSRIRASRRSGTWGLRWTSPGSSSSLPR